MRDSIYQIIIDWKKEEDDGEGKWKSIYNMPLRKNNHVLDRSYKTNAQTINHFANIFVWASNLNHLATCVHRLNPHTNIHTHQNAHKNTYTHECTNTKHHTIWLIIGFFVFVPFKRCQIRDCFQDSSLKHELWCPCCQRPLCFVNYYLPKKNE